MLQLSEQEHGNTTKARQTQNRADERKNKKDKKEKTL